MGCAFRPLALPPSSADKPGDFGEDCLSAKREFRSRPVWLAAQGTRSEAEGGGVGSPFLRLHSFGEAKEGTSRRAAPGNQTTREAQQPTGSNLIFLQKRHVSSVLLDLQPFQEAHAKQHEGHAAVLHQTVHLVQCDAAHPHRVESDAVGGNHAVCG